MAIYINKEIDIYNYEVEIALEESEVLEDIDTDVLLEFVIDRCNASRILNKMDAGDIVAHIANDKKALAELLRAVADQIKYQ